MESSNKEWVDPYIDKDSGCLRNNFNISNEEQLSKIEVAFSSFRSIEILRSPLPKTLDFEFLQSIHKQLFKDIYDWAGEVRQVEMFKGSTKFAPASIIEKGGSYIFGKLSQENNLQGLGVERFSNRAGYYLGEINHLHPFREGNGRTQRTLISKLAYENGYHIVWDNIIREHMIEASIAAHNGDYSKLENIIRTNIVDRDYNEAIKIVNDVKKYNPEIKKAEEGKLYNGKVIGITDHYIVQELEQNQVILHNKNYLTKEINTFLNQNIEINYPYGKIGIIKLQSEKDLSDKEYKYKNEYER